MPQADQNGARRRLSGGRAPRKPSWKTKLQFSWADDTVRPQFLRLLKLAQVDKSIGRQIDKSISRWIGRSVGSPCSRVGFRKREVRRLFPAHRILVLVGMEAMMLRALGQSGNRN